MYQHHPITAGNVTGALYQGITVLQDKRQDNIDMYQ